MCYLLCNIYSGANEMLHRFTQQKKTKMKTFLHCTVDTVLLSLTAVLTKSQVACKTKPDEYLYYEKKKGKEEVCMVAFVTGLFGLPMVYYDLCTA